MAPADQSAGGSRRRRGAGAGSGRCGVSRSGERPDW